MLTVLKRIRCEGVTITYSFLGHLKAEDLATSNPNLLLITANSPHTLKLSDYRPVYLPIANYFTSFISLYSSLKPTCILRLCPVVNTLETKSR
jgi:hypothetical protein